MAPANVLNNYTKMIGYNIYIYIYLFIYLYILVFMKVASLLTGKLP